MGRLREARQTIHWLSGKKVMLELKLLWLEPRCPFLSSAPPIESIALAKITSLALVLLMAPVVLLETLTP